MNRFLPAFLAAADAAGNIELLAPHAKVIGLTGEAPDGFEGAYVYYAPPVYPALIMSGDRPGECYRVPNRIVESDDDWKRYTVEYHARRSWRYNANPTTANIAANARARAENKARGDAALAAFAFAKQKG